MHDKILKLFTILFITLFTISLSSCASKHKVQKERSDTFIADIDAFEIDEIPLYASLALTNPKVCNFALDFYPRTNSIVVESRISVDSVSIKFSYEERKKIYEAALKYLELYQNKEIKNEKPNKKNTLTGGNLPLMWGVVGLSHSLTVKYTVNIEFLEPDKPYFRLKLDATDDYTDNSSSPPINIYISPSQWEKIMEMCSQERLEQMTDDILAQAEEF